MAEAILLGSGTSNGVPTLGMTYPAEFLANPKNHRNRACLALLGPTGNLIVDCPPELRLMCTKAGIVDIESVLITHSHADHLMGMDDLRSICLKTGKAMPVYALPRYQEDIRRVFGYAFQDFPAGIFVPRFDLRDVPTTLRVGGMAIETFIVSHGKIPVVGLRMGDLAYITDVSEIPPEAMERLAGLDVLILDAVRKAPHPNHFNLEQAVETAQRIGARQTYFTHLSADYDHDVTNAELPLGIELGYDGLRLAV